MRKFFSLIAAVLFAGSMMAETTTLASGTFNGKDSTYTEGWTTTGTGKGRTDCIVIGAGENITSPSVDLTEYTKITVKIKARRYGSLSGSKAEIAVAFAGTAIGTTEASGTSATADLTVIEYTNTELTTGQFVITCTNATSAGSTHGAGINSIEIIGEKTGGVGEPKYYVAGTMTNWAANPAYELVANPNAAGEYMGEFIFDANDSLKVIMDNGSAEYTWYPAGGTPNFGISQAGEYKVYFRPDGQGGSDWYYGYFNVMMKEPALPISCADVYKLAKNDVVENLNEVVVTYVNGKNVWVKDETASLLLYLPADATWAAGDKLAGVAGTVDIYQTLVYEIKPSADQVAAVTATPGEAPAAEEKDSVVAADVNKYIVMNNIEFEKDTAFVEGTASNITMNDVVVRNNFKNGFAFKAGKKYNVYGVVSAYKGAPQVYFITAEEEVPVVHTYTVAGAPSTVFGENWNPALEANDMQQLIGGDGYIWSKDTAEVSVGALVFKVVEDHSWDNKAYPAENYILELEPAYYNIVITFNPAAQPDSMVKAIATKVGELPIVGGWEEILFTAATAAEDLPEDSVFKSNKEGFEAQIADAGNKMAIDANDARFGTAEEYAMYNYRLKSGGASGADKNFVTVAIPADGQFRVAVRTGSNSATDRALYLIQDGDTIYNGIIQESMAVKVMEDSVEVKVYPFVEVPVKAGNVIVRYSAGLNFYGFGLNNSLPPVVKPVYTVVGSSAPLFGKTWDQTYEANDMQPITGSEYLYAWKKENVALTAGDIEYKVCQNHDWNPAWPAQGNYSFNIAKAGLYDITIFFNPDLETPTKVDTVFKGEVVVLPNIIMHGNFTGSWADTDPFVAAQDSLTASLTLALAEGTYEFGFKFDGTWKANGATITREANTANLATGSGNMKIAADVPGNYLFTYTYATQEVVVTYPNPIIVHDTIDVNLSAGLRFYDNVAAAGWWELYGGNDKYVIELSNVSTTQIAGVYTIDDLDPNYAYIGIINGEDTTYVNFVDGAITLTVNDNGDVTAVGALVGEDGNVYNLYLAYVVPMPTETVNVNIAEGKMNDVYADYGLYGVYGTDTTANVFVQLAIWAEDGFQGNFTEKDLDSKYLGSGIVEGLTAPDIYTAAITVTPGNGGDYNITADILCYNNKLYKVTMYISGAQGIEGVEAAVKAIKSLQNGVLLIEKAGKTYNAAGNLVR